MCAVERRERAAPKHLGDKHTAMGTIICSDCFHRELLAYDMLSARAAGWTGRGWEKKYKKKATGDREGRGNAPHEPLKRRRILRRRRGRPIAVSRRPRHDVSLAAARQGAEQLLRSSSTIFLLRRFHFLVRELLQRLVTQHAPGFAQRTRRNGSGGGLV